ncbi:hypothetical protein EJB05_39490, partial [Eragrostis curvula]
MVKAIKSHELETDVPAAELWKIYGTRRFVEVVHQLLPQLLQKVVIVRGDGGIGTITLKYGVLPGSPSPVTYKEEFTKIDNENYIKEVTAIEGDVLKPGFTKYVTRLQIIDKGPSSSVIKSSVEYEIDDGHPELEAAVTTTPFALAARAIAKYVKENK